MERIKTGKHNQQGEKSINKNIPADDTDGRINTRTLRVTVTMVIMFKKKISMLSKDTEDNKKTSQLKHLE